MKTFVTEAIETFRASVDGWLERGESIFSAQHELEVLSRGVKPEDLINNALRQLRSGAVEAVQAMPGRVIAYSCAKWSVSLMIGQPDPAEDAPVEVLPMDCLIVTANGRPISFEGYAVHPEGALVAGDSIPCLRSTGTHSGHAIRICKGKDAIRPLFTAVTPLWCLIDEPTLGRTWYFDSASGRLLNSVIDDYAVGNALFKLSLFLPGRLGGAAKDMLSDLCHHPVSEVRQAALQISRFNDSSA